MNDPVESSEGPASRLTSARAPTSYELPPGRFVRFDVLGLPRGQPRIRVGRIGNHARAFKGKAAVEMETTFRALATPCAPAEPYSGPISLDMTCWFPIPTSWPKWKQKAAAEQRVYPTQKPDADNCAKLVQDALTDLFWKDDRQVVSLIVHKRYTKGQPRTSLLVRELDEARRAGGHGGVQDAGVVARVTARHVEVRHDRA